MFRVHLSWSVWSNNERRWIVKRTCEKQISLLDSVSAVAGGGGEKENNIVERTQHAGGRGVGVALGNRRVRGAL